MTTPFNQLMAEATRLTRAGDLSSATTAIQTALRGLASATTPDPSGSAHGDESLVIDVEAREIHPDGEPAAPTAFPLGAGQFIAGHHSEAAGTRDYKLYIPPMAGERPLPLVVMLHGCTQDPDDFAAGTGMNEQARALGFFVLYPAQAQGANPSRCWNWFKHNHQRRGRGEPALLAGMTRAVMLRHGIDPKRVYVAGLSAGGAMAAILGEAYPELYAAVGVHSGLPAGAARDLPSALAAMKSGGAARSGEHPAAVRTPIIVFHGDQDPTVHPANGEHLVAHHARAAAPNSQRARSAEGREYTRRVWRDAGGRPVAEHWMVHGAGHAWSGGSARGSYTDAQGPDATAALLDFFFAHVRPDSP